MCCLSTVSAFLYKTSKVHRTANQDTRKNSYDPGATCLSIARLPGTWKISAGLVNLKQSAESERSLGNLKIMMSVPNF